MHELLTTDEMAQADALAIAAGTSGIALMERAGRAVAEVVGQMVSAGGSVIVLCGPGNNGGDGFVAARVLAGRGYSVSLVFLGELSALKGDARLAADMWQGDIASPDFMSGQGVGAVCWIKLESSHNKRVALGKKLKTYRVVFDIVLLSHVPESQDADEANDCYVDEDDELPPPVKVPHVEVTEFTVNVVALEKFDAGRGVPFWFFAVHSVRAEIERVARGGR
jgi:hydroxyethylthiazole kinase-like uncharacterized protein yjeF